MLDDTMELIDKYTVEHPFTKIRIVDSGERFVTLYLLTYGKYSMRALVDRGITPLQIAKLFHRFETDCKSRENPGV